MMLVDFFEPFSPKIALLSILFVLSLDIIGLSIRKFVFCNTENYELRAVDWTLGLGVFIFFWWALAFFVMPQLAPLSCSLVGAAGISLYAMGPKNYQKQLIEGFKNSFDAWPLFILLLPFLVISFFKLSVPANSGDESFYHFISPSTFLHNYSWANLSVGNHLYQMVPRFLDSMYIITFVATKTYSMARFVQSLIFISSLTAIFLFFMRNFGRTTAIVLSFCYLSMANVDLPYLITTGLVDGTTAAFHALGALCLLQFFLTPQRSWLYQSTAFFALALGTKYSGLTFFIVMFCFLVVVVLRSPQHRKELLNSKALATLTLIFLIFGGFWYVKNLILTGNPTYPFCTSGCVDREEYFKGWTTPVTLENALDIVILLFSGSKYILLLLLAGLSMPFVKGNPTVRKACLFFVMGVVVDLIMLKMTSVFYHRYAMHLQLMTVFAVSVCIGLLYDRISNQAKIALVAILVIFLAPTYGSHVRAMYKIVEPADVSLSLGQITPREWIQKTQPTLFDVVEWCEKPTESGRPTPVAVFEPDLVWPKHGDLVAPFYVNCEGKVVRPVATTREELLKEVRESKLQFYFVASKTCAESSPTSPKDLTNVDTRTRYLRWLNYEMVCLSKQITPHLFYFDYTTLPSK